MNVDEQVNECVRNCGCPGSGLCRCVQLPPKHLLGTGRPGDCLGRGESQVAWSLWGQDGRWDLPGPAEKRSVSFSVTQRTQSWGRAGREEERSTLGKKGPWDLLRRAGKRDGVHEDICVTPGQRDLEGSQPGPWGRSLAPGEGPEGSHG